MKKKYYAVLLCVCISILIPTAKTFAQDPITLIIKEAVIKVIKAADLRIQRLQNETIWLQNAQKTVENTMAKLKLEEISDWVEKQRELYADYFEELQKVKAVLSYYHKVREIMELEIALVRDYKRAFAAIRNDDHFSVEEIQYMVEIYTGIMEESLKNLDALSLVLQSFTTQMTDAKRLQMIDEIAAAIEESYGDLKRFNTHNSGLSLARAHDANEVKLVKALYGID